MANVFFTSHDILSAMRNLILAVALLSPSLSHAFSASGHRIVDDIAWQKMDKSVRAQAILKKHPRLKEDFLPNMPDSVRAGNRAMKERWLFQHAGTWPDIARGIADQDEQKKYNRSTWHYVNFAAYLRKSDVELIDLSRVNRSTDWDGNYESERLNVIQSLKLNVGGYRDKSRTDAQRAVHLCWILHLGGDSHQPLHSTALFTPTLFPKGCRGGNSISIDGGSNLHSTWDRLLPNEKTVGGVASVASKLIKQEHEKAIKSSKELDPKVWIDESVKLAQDYAYSRNVRAAIRAADESGETEVTVKLSEQYRKTAGRVAQRRVVQAGYRIARILNARDSNGKVQKKSSRNR